jgi:hypothetical protein
MPSRDRDCAGVRWASIRRWHRVRERRISMLCHPRRDDAGERVHAGRVRSGIGVVLALAVGALSLMAASPAGAGPTASSSWPVTAIPDEAMLQPADLGGAETAPAADDLRPWLRPPQPFGPYRSDGQRGTERAIQILYPVSDIRPTVLLEYVTVYRGGGAAQYLREFTRAVTRCRPPPVPCARPPTGPSGSAHSAGCPPPRPPSTTAVRSSAAFRIPPAPGSPRCSCLRPTVGGERRGRGGPHRTTRGPAAEALPPSPAVAERPAAAGPSQ